MPPPPIFQRTKSALFAQGNVAVNSKITSKVPFLFGNFDVFNQILVKNVQFRYGMYVNTKLTSKVPFFYGNFDVFKINLVKNMQFRYGMTGKSPPPPRRQHFRENVFRCPFQYPKVPLEAGATPLPQSFDASYAPVYKQNVLNFGHHILIYNNFTESNILFKRRTFCMLRRKQI